MAGKPLTGVKVLELEGIGPCPLSSCVLADYGADVITVCRAGNGRVMSQNDPVSRGKRSIAINLQSPEGVATLKKLTSQVDVFLEPFRPGTCEKLGIGPDVLCAENPRLIYGRMTGFGQGGNKFEKMAGHDANYLALSGSLDLFRRGDESPFPPVNFAGDYAGGGMMLAMGVCLALLERHQSGKGQVIDAAMTDGANYVALPLHKWASSGFLPMQSDGHLDSKKFILVQASHFVDSYLCKEDPKKPGTKQYMSVQSIEPQFYAALLKGLGLEKEEGSLPAQFDQSGWPWMKARFASIFLTKTRDEWAEIFYGTDSCCVPILNLEEAAVHPHNVARGSFAPTPGSPGKFEPAPAPKLSRTPGYDPRPEPVPGSHTEAVLGEFGFAEARISELLNSGTVAVAKKGKASPPASKSLAPGKSNL